MANKLVNIVLTADANIKFTVSSVRDDEDYLSMFGPVSDGWFIARQLDAEVNDYAGKPSLDPGPFAYDIVVFHLPETVLTVAPFKLELSIGSVTRCGYTYNC